MAEQQIGLVQEADGASRASMESRASRESSYWGDDYTEMLMGLEQIKALGDVLTTAITEITDVDVNEKSAEHLGGSLWGLNYATLPTLGHLLQEKADRIKTLLQKHELVLAELPIQ
jgi:hypothetical protein